MPKAVLSLLEREFTKFKAQQFVDFIGHAWILHSRNDTCSTAVAAIPPPPPLAVLQKLTIVVNTEN